MNHHLGLGGTWLVGEILIIRRSLDNVRVFETCAFNLTRYSAFLAGFGAFVKIRRPFSSSPNLWALVVAPSTSSFTSIFPTRQTGASSGSLSRLRSPERSVVRTKDDMAIWWVVIPVRETTVVGGSNLRQRGCDRRSPMKNNVVKKREIGTKKKKENMYRGSILRQE